MSDRTTQTMQQVGNKHIMFARDLLLDDYITEFHLIRRAVMTKSHCFGQKYQ